MPEELKNNAEPQATAQGTAQPPEAQQSESTTPDVMTSDLEDKSIDELKAIEKQLKEAASKEENGEEEAPAPDAAKPKGDAKPPEPPPQKVDYETEYKKSQSMIGRQSNEIGELRRQIAELMAKVNPPADQKKISDEELAALQIENPRKAAEIIEAERLAERQRFEEIQRQESAKRAETVKQLAPDLAENVDEIVNLLQTEDRVPDDQLILIAKNFDKLSPDTQYQFNMRAKAAKKIRDLEKQIAELKAVPEKISAAKGQPSILQKTPTMAPNASRNYTDAELDEMTPEQLRALENEMKKKG